MLGDFLTRIFILLLGYAYPAFECYKSVEKNKVTIDELRFWCQYWIIIAIITVFERFGDIFISWLPMYGELKLAFFIYLWYPKTKGTGYIYETMFKPIIAKHENEIDRKLMELKARAWDFALYYWQNCTKMGQSTFFQLLEYLASQSGKVQVPKKEPDTKSKKDDNHEPSAPPRAAARDSEEVSVHPRRAARDSEEGSVHHRAAAFLSESPSMSKHRNSKWPPRPPTSGTINRSVSELSKSNRFQVRLDEQTESVKTLDSTAESEPNNNLLQARMKLRRSTTMQA
ncbi:putative HVA22-like protein g [Euphorbia lathyris]|uniref:putative HVA22-like protein g n=1 Tax=Euphorbia lathyris TaxID=212925 RepID=UPI003313C68A